MSDYRIRPMELEELPGIFQHIAADFPPGEYAPYEILYRQINNQQQSGWIYGRDHKQLAYAFLTNGTQFVLLSLLAVFPPFRGQGTGKSFLRQILNQYADRQAMIGEVERPELADDEAEKNRRVRRIKFYEDAGFYLIPGIDYTIWDVPMHLMAYPMKTPRQIINEDIGSIMEQIYLPLMGRQFMHKLSVAPTAK